MLVLMYFSPQYSDVFSEIHIKVQVLDVYSMQS